MAATLFLYSCATDSQMPIRPFAAPPSAVGKGENPWGQKSRQAVTPDPNQRPGLATGYGTQIRDIDRPTSFVRASSNPAETSLIYYNTRDGVNAMQGGGRAPNRRRLRNGFLEWGIESSSGRDLKTRHYRGQRIVEGRPGQSYQIVLKNLARSRVEVVLSVDGLDVRTGQRASSRNQGYVIPAESTVRIKGWRSGPETVARFKFTSVGVSYANRLTGDTANVGVIGLAIYGEKGVAPFKWMPSELHTRRQASPFAPAP